MGLAYPWWRRFGTMAHNVGWGTTCTVTVSTWKQEWDQWQNGCTLAWYYLPLASFPGPPPARRRQWNLLSTFPPTFGLAIPNIVQIILSWTRFTTCSLTVALLETTTQSCESLTVISSNGFWDLTCSSWKGKGQHRKQCRLRTRPGLAWTCYLHVATTNLSNTAWVQIDMYSVATRKANLRSTVIWENFVVKIFS